MIQIYIDWKGIILKESATIGDPQSQHLLNSFVVHSTHYREEGGFKKEIMGWRYERDSNSMVRDLQKTGKNLAREKERGGRSENSSTSTFSPTPTRQRSCILGRRINPQNCPGRIYPPCHGKGQYCCAFGNHLSSFCLVIIKITQI